MSLCNKLASNIDCFFTSLSSIHKTLLIIGNISFYAIIFILVYILSLLLLLLIYVIVRCPYQPIVRNLFIYLYYWTICPFYSLNKQYYYYYNYYRRLARDVCAQCVMPNKHSEYTPP